MFVCRLSKFGLFIACSGEKENTTENISSQQKMHFCSERIPLAGLGLHFKQICHLSFEGRAPVGTPCSWGGSDAFERPLRVMSIKQRSGMLSCTAGPPPSLPPEFVKPVSCRNCFLSFFFSHPILPNPSRFMKNRKITLITPCFDIW